MKLEPIDDWDTIDNEFLSKIIYETSVDIETNDKKDTDTTLQTANPEVPPHRPSKQNSVQAQINHFST